jgi:hypothetical protein
VAHAGSLGFLAAGCKTAAAVRDDIDELRSLTSAASGANIFAPPENPPSAAAMEAYAAHLGGDAKRYDQVAASDPRNLVFVAIDAEWWGRRAPVVWVRFRTFGGQTGCVWLGSGAAAGSSSMDCRKLLHVR